MAQNPARGLTPPARLAIGGYAEALSLRAGGVRHHPPGGESGTTKLLLPLLLALALPLSAQVTDGTVRSFQKISDTDGNFTAMLEDYDFFGTSVASLGDIDGDSVPDLAVGAFLDDDGGSGRGALYVLFMNADGTVKSHQKISATAGNFIDALDDWDRFGSSVASLGDIDGDGLADLAVGALGDAGGGSGRGAIYILFMNADGSVKSHQKIGATAGNFTATLDNSDWFGNSVAALGDLDGDSIPDVAVGAYGDEDGGSNRGAIYILFLNADGTVKSHQKISSTDGNFTAMLGDSDWFGISVTGLGDLDGDAVPDLAVGAYFDDDGGTDRGAVYVLFMNADGTVKSHRKISDTAGDFNAILSDTDLFGVSVAGLGDFDGDSIPDLAVGANGDDDGGSGRGALYVLFMNADGTVKSHRKISDTAGNFTATLDDDDRFGSSLAPLGDMDGDAVPDLAVGAFFDDDGGSYRGAVYVLFLQKPAPATPTGLTAAAGDGKIELHWNPNGETDFLKYYIYGGVTASPTTVIDSSAGGELNDTTATITGLTNGTSYYYRITAVDSSGRESAYSDEVSVTPFNTAPVISSAATADATEDVRFVYLATGSDADGATLAYSFDLTPTWLSSAADSIFGTPLEGNLDTTFRIIASDGDLTDTLVVAVTVTPVNDPPGPFALLVPADADTAETVNDSLLFVWESSSDMDGDTLAYIFYLQGPAYDTTITGLTDTTLLLTGIASLALDSIYTWFVDAFDGTDTTGSIADYHFRMPSVLAIDPLAGIPAEFALHQNYPNPFNPATTVGFDLPVATETRLVIYDLLGRQQAELSNQILEPGYYRMVWNGRDRYGRNVPSGIYIARLVAPGYTKSIKMVLLK